MQETATDSAQSTQEEGTDMATASATQEKTQESTTPKSPKGQIHDIVLSQSQERLGTIRNRRDAFKTARFFRDGMPEKASAFLPQEDVERAIRLLGNGKKTSVQIVQYERDEENPESRATIEEVFSLSPRVKKEESSKKTSESSKKEESTESTQETTPPSSEKTQKTTPKKTTTRKTSSEETHQSAKRAA